MAIYYMKFGGDDGLDGLSHENAWGTVGKFNATTFLPGDTIRLYGNDTFIGMMVIRDSGTANNPIRITSYGTGKAIINIVSHDQSGVRIIDSEYVHVTNLKVVGSGIALDHNALTPQNNWHGIDAVSTLRTRPGGRLKGIKILNNDVSGFRTGVLFRADDSDGGGGQSQWVGFDGAVIQYNDVRNNSTGIFTWANINAPLLTTEQRATYPTGYYPAINIYPGTTVYEASTIHLNFTIADNKVYDNHGFNDIHPDNTTRPDGQPLRRPDYLLMRSGAGIRTCNLGHSIIERNWVNNCGHMGTQDQYSGPYNYDGYDYYGDGVTQQPANVEGELCENNIWQDNESSYCRMMPLGTLDGAAFDVFDGWVNNSILQRNYGHNCDGYAFGIGGFGPTNINTNCVVRDNIFVNNTKKVKAADVHWSGYQNGLYIYNNTIYNEGTTNVLFWFMPDIFNANIVNNIFYTPNTVAYIEPTNKPLFVGNVYIGNGIPSQAQPTLESWRLSGQEKFNNVDYGRLGTTITFNAAGATPQMLPNNPVSELTAYDYTENVLNEVPESVFNALGIYFPTTVDFHGNTYSFSNMKVGATQSTQTATYPIRMYGFNLVLAA